MNIPQADARVGGQFGNAARAAGQELVAVQVFGALHVDGGRQAHGCDAVRAAQGHAFVLRTADAVIALIMRVIWVNNTNAFVINYMEMKY